MRKNGDRWRPYSKWCSSCTSALHWQKVKDIPFKDRPEYRRVRERARNRFWIIRYGIDETEFNRLLEKQKQKCKICKKVKHSQEKPLHVEHNHKSKRVRGLVCSRCNRLIGVFENHPELVTRIIQYLAEDAPQQSVLFTQRGQDLDCAASAQHARADARLQSYSGPLRFATGRSIYL